MSSQGIYAIGDGSNVTGFDFVSMAYCKLALTGNRAMRHQVLSYSRLVPNVIMSNTAKDRFRSRSRSRL